MRGTPVPLAWQYDPAQYAPPRYRRGCRYEAFVPHSLSDPPPIAAAVAGTLSAAEHAIRELNAAARPALQPLARLLRARRALADGQDARDGRR